MIPESQVFKRFGYLDLEPAKNPENSASQAFFSYFSALRLVSSSHYLLQRYILGRRGDIPNGAAKTF